MFRVHHINTNDISIKNLILLFLTIVMWFASVITLAYIEIPSNIDNARQTIGRITITEDGTSSTATGMDISSWGIYINTNILYPQSSFSGKVLGLDDNGYVIYVDSQNLVTSWSSGGGWGWTGGYRTWAGDDIYNTNSGNIGIWTSTMSGKLHITSAGTTDVYIEDTNSWSAANINFQNTVNRWMIGGYAQRFYIGLNGTAFINIITGGYVGIGTTGPKAPLQVIGNLIAGEYSNTINGSNSSIAWWSGNIVTGDRSFIWGWDGNKIDNSGWWFIWWWRANYIWSWSTRPENTIVWWNNNIISWWATQSFIWGWWSNTIWSNIQNGTIVWWASNWITSSNYWFIGWWQANTIYSSVNSFIWWWAGNKIYTAEKATIGGGDSNTITWDSNFSVIQGWEGNRIENAQYSFAGWKSAKVYADNIFLWNSDTTSFSGNQQGSFIINAPVAYRMGGVGININNPETALDVEWLIRTRPNSPLQACAMDIQWAIGFSGTHFYGCNGIAWNQLD